MSPTRARSITHVAGSIFLNPTGTLSVGNYASLTGPVINKPFVMNGGTLQTDSTGTNGNATLTTGISLNAVGNIAAQTGSTLTLNGAIVNGTSSTSGVSYSGGGTVALGVASNYGGPTTINGPTLRANSGVNNTLPIATDLIAHRRRARSEREESASQLARGGRGHDH